MAHSGNLLEIGVTDKKKAQQLMLRPYVPITDAQITNHLLLKDDCAPGTSFSIPATSSIAACKSQ